VPALRQGLASAKTGSPHLPDVQEFLLGRAESEGELMAARLLNLQPKLSHLTPEIVQEPTRDGLDYRRLCHAHKWCSLDSVSLELLAQCPFCACDLEQRTARLRYAMVTERVRRGL
jgi:hypothetical protein